MTKSNIPDSSSLWRGELNPRQEKVTIHEDKLYLALKTELAWIIVQSFMEAPFQSRSHAQRVDMIDIMIE